MAHFTVDNVSNFISIYIPYNLLLAVHFELKLKTDIYHTSLNIQQRFCGTIISLLIAETSQKKAVQKNTILHTNDIPQTTLCRKVPAVS